MKKTLSENFVHTIRAVFNCIKLTGTNLLIYNSLSNRVDIMSYYFNKWLLYAGLFPIFLFAVIFIRNLNVKEAVDVAQPKTEDSSLPIILFYVNDIDAGGEFLTCGADQCYYSYNKSLINNTNTRAILVYGPALFWVDDLPLPRQPHHEWGLYQDETPDTNFLLQTDDIINLFNHTATPQRTSDFPLTLQYLHSVEALESTEYFLSTQLKNELRVKGIAPVSCLSTCHGSSDRGNFLKAFMSVVQVDSYGECYNTKPLPEELVSNDTSDDVTRDVPPSGDPRLIHFLARYKFTLVLENAVCKDYVTEKFWRTLVSGSVPIYLGPYESIKDLIPYEKSVIAVSDFKTIHELANYIKFLDENDEEYEKYVSFKYKGIRNSFLKETLALRPWDVSPVFNDTVSTLPQLLKFSCMICNRVHENIRRVKRGETAIQYKTNKNHYRCEQPRVFSNIASGILKHTADKEFKDDHGLTLDEARICAQSIVQAMQTNASSSEVKRIVKGRLQKDKK